jgi:hypothetical protein
MELLYALINILSTKFRYPENYYTGQGFGPGGAALTEFIELCLHRNSAGSFVEVPD